MDKHLKEILEKGGLLRASLMKIIDWLGLISGNSHSLGSLNSVMSFTKDWLAEIGAMLIPRKNW